jgi:hypothetical protein
MMNKARRRGFGLLAVWGSGVLVACSVDTSGLHYLPDSEFHDLANQGEAGDGNVDVGGVANIAGVSNKAGSNGKAGSSSGGTTSVGGNASSGASSGGSLAVGGAGGTPSGGVTGGGMPGGGMPNSCTPAVGSSSDPLLDDFNDMNPMLPTPMNATRMGGWYITNDGKGSMVPPADPNQPPIPNFKPDYNNMGYAMHLKGSGFSLWGANLGVTLLNVPGRPPCPYDLSRFKGIRFYLQGTSSDQTLHFSLTTVETADMQHGGSCDGMKEKCFDNYFADMAWMPPTWKVIEVEWASLKQGNWGAVKPLNMQHVLNIEFGTKPNVQFDFSIDQIEFY